jgi:MFS family permease
MIDSRRWLVPLCLAACFWSFSFGLNAPVASLAMKTAGCSDTLIGLNTGVYYLGIAVAAGAVPWLLRRCGHGCLLLGMTLSGLTAAAFPFCGGLSGWFIVRALNGAAGALSLIPLETYVNRNSPAGRRALFFGYYAFCVALGMALGTLVGLQSYPDWPRGTFVIGGTGGLLAAAVVLVWRPVLPEGETLGPRQAPLGLGRNSLSFGSAWSQGFLEGGMIGLLPIYLLAIGLSEDAAGWLMSGLMIGVILAQVPIAWLADRLGRTTALVGCNLVVLAGIVCLLIPGSTLWLGLWLFVVGACGGAFYPLGLALLGERMPSNELARANARYLAINCLGSLMGPALSGAAMDWFGRAALFVAGGGAIALVLAFWLLSEGRRFRFGGLSVSGPARQTNDSADAFDAAA